MSGLPKGWVEATLADVGDWTSGGTPSRANPAYFGGNIPWVKTGDLDHGPVDQVGESITESGLQNSAAKVIPSGSLLVAMYGATIGQTGQLVFDAASNQACAALIASARTKAVIPFVWKYLIFQQDALKEAGQGGAQPNISQTFLKAYSISMPPLAEQRRIVAKIDRLSARSKRARDELEQVEATIKYYKGALLQQAFRGELTAYWRKIWPGECAKSCENLDEERQAAIDGWNAERSRSRRYQVAREPSWQPQFDLPQAWRWTSVDAISSAVQYGSSAKTTSDASGVVVLRMGNLQRGRIDVSDVRYLPEDHEEFPDLLLRQGDILFNRTNSFELVGKTAVFDEVQPTSFASYLIRLRLFGFEPLLLAWYINSSIGREWIAAVSSQQVGQANVNGSKLAELAVPLMSTAEQHEIVRRIEHAFAAIDRLAAEAQSARALLDKLDQAILVKAFRGELVPQDPNEEPASVLLERIRDECAATPVKPRGRRKA